MVFTLLVDNVDTDAPYHMRHKQGNLSASHTIMIEDYMFHLKTCCQKVKCSGMQYSTF